MIQDIDSKMLRYSESVAAHQPAPRRGIRPRASEAFPDDGRALHLPVNIQQALPGGSISIHRPDFVHQPSFKAGEAIPGLCQPSNMLRFSVSLCGLMRYLLACEGLVAAPNNSLGQLWQLFAFRLNIGFRHRAWTSHLNLNVQTPASTKTAPYTGTETRQFHVLSMSKNLKADLSMPDPSTLLSRAAICCQNSPSERPDGVPNISVSISGGIIGSGVIGICAVSPFDAAAATADGLAVG